MPDPEYIQYVEQVKSVLERRWPGVFEFRFGCPSASWVAGLIVTRAGLPGYALVTGNSDAKTWSRGGVLLPDTRHHFGVYFMEHREWEVPEQAHIHNRTLESWCSEDPEFIAEKFQDWAFERPWEAPPAIDSRQETQRLQRLVEGRSARFPEVDQARVRALFEAGNQVQAAERVGLDLLLHPPDDLAPAVREQLDRDVAGLGPDLLAWNFPMDPRGNLALGTTILLAQYETPKPPAKDRVLCLAAVGPERRKDPQRIRIELVPLIVLNQDHNWEHERWLWHENGANADEIERWGAAGLPVKRLLSGASAIPALQKACDSGKAKEGQRAALAILLQDAGQLVEALALYQIELSEELHRLLGGQKIYPRGMCSVADQAWGDLLRSVLHDCAPWLMVRALIREAQRLEAWAKAKSGRPHRTPLLKVTNFPGQHHQSKVCLMLKADKNGDQRRLEIGSTGSNARLHETGWRRPLELDLLRYGVN